jgi:hypothetical protein
MACPTVTFATYKADGGTADEATFDSCLRWATAVVREVVWPNVPDGDAQTDAWARAVSAAIDADASNGSGHGLDDVASGSLSIGDWSESSTGTAAPASDGATVSAMRSAARRELVGSGLLYAGLGSLS